MLSRLSHVYYCNSCTVVDDVRLIRGNLLFSVMDGLQRKCGCLAIEQDLIDEGDEVFDVVLSSTDSRVSFPTNTATVTIIDDDGK